MHDCFAQLDEPRRPWLDAEALKEKFHALAAAHHPDVAHGGTVDFAALNAAHETLRDPVRRVRHLLELEAPGALARPAQIPSAIGDLFMQIAAQQQALDVFLKKQTAAGSPLARALIEPEKLSLLESTGELLARVNARHAELFDDLRALDADWLQEKSRSTPQLAVVFQSLSYVSKWIAQLNEGVVKLSI